jgi:hypothetical protein
MRGSEEAREHPTPGTAQQVGHLLDIAGPQDLVRLQTICVVRVDDDPRLALGLHVGGEIGPTALDDGAKTCRAALGSRGVPEEPIRGVRVDRGRA